MREKKKNSSKTENRISVKKLTELSLLTAAALILYIVESWIPVAVPIPGMKLGLANIITVVAVYRMMPGEVAIMVLVRLLLGSFFAGSISSLLFSGAGAMFCLAGMLVLRKILSPKDIPLCSVLGAVLHNIGQMTVAVWVMDDIRVLAYLPILLVTGCIAGLFTGVCAGAVMKRIPKKS